MPWIAEGAEAPWGEDASWGGEFGTVPDGGLRDVAVVDGGAVAVVTDEQNPGGVSIGNVSSAIGQVDVRDGGVLEAFSEVGDEDSPENAIVVGMSGVGTLNVEGGGAAISRTLTSGGRAGGGIFLSGDASVSVDVSSTLDSALVVNGPDVDFSTGTLSMGANHTYTQAFTSGAASTLNVAGSATIGGSLHLDFSAAPAPAAGDTFDLIQVGGNVLGAFNQVSSTGAGLTSGQQFVVNNVASNNDRIVQAELINALVLQVNRDDGTMSILNPTGASIDFDAYQIESELGSLNAAGFAGLASQGEAGWDPLSS
ncbi:MAG: hypothetical protein AAF961_17925, partial [Planctomycetota bacterium]